MKCLLQPIAIMAMFLVVFGLAVSSEVSGEKVHLKNGQVFSGTVTKIENAVRIVTDDGAEFVIPTEDVDRVVSAESSEETRIAEAKVIVSKYINGMQRDPEADLWREERKLLKLSDHAVAPVASAIGKVSNTIITQRLIHLLSKIRTTRAAEALITLSISDRVDVRDDVAVAMGVFSDAATASQLVQMLDFDKDEWVRESAINSIGARREWMAIPALCRVIVKDAQLREIAGKALVSIDESATSVFLRRMIMSKNNVVASISWNVLESVALPFQAGYVGQFLTGTNRKWDKRVMSLLERFDDGSLTSHISLLSVKDDHIRGLAALQLIGLSNGQKFGLDVDGWREWARENRNPVVGITAFKGIDDETVLAVMKMIDSIGRVKVKGLRKIKPPAPIEKSSPPEYDGEELLEHLKGVARKKRVDLIICLTRRKVIQSGQDVTYSVIRPAHAAVVSSYHFISNDLKILRNRTCLQSMNALAQLLWLQECPDNKRSCPATQAASLREIDALSPEWSDTCRVKLQSALNVLRAKYAGDMPQAAKEMTDLMAGQNAPWVFREAALDCERGIHPKLAIDYWRKYLDSIEDASISRLVQDRVETLEKLAD